MDSADRQKLETAIEREAYRLVEQIREHMYDHTMIYLNRNQVDIDRTVADQILTIAKNGVTDGLLSKLDFFKEKIDKVLTEYTETENPLQPGKPSKKAKG
jgi:FlaG/FlaF family flagellin (archaellin)